MTRSDLVPDLVPDLVLFMERGTFEMTSSPVPSPYGGDEVIDPAAHLVPTSPSHLVPGGHVTRSFDPSIAPRHHTGMAALTTALERRGELTRIAALDVIEATGLAPRTAADIVNSASSHQWTRTHGKQRNGIDRRIISPGPLFDEAPRP